MLDLQDDLQTVLYNICSKYETIIIVTKKKLVSPKLVAALDRCQLSMRHCIYSSNYSRYLDIHL